MGVHKDQKNNKMEPHQVLYREHLMLNKHSLGSCIKKESVNAYLYCRSAERFGDCTVSMSEITSAFLLSDSSLIPLAVLTNFSVSTRLIQPDSRMNFSSSL